MAMGEAYIVGGMLAMFPLAFLYRRFVYSLAPSHKDLFFTLTGLLTVLLCFGSSSLHLLISLMMCYAVMLLLGVSKVSCAVIFLSTMSHLLWGYVSVSGKVYTVTWTLIYCQATLKLAGIVFELWDHRDKEHRDGVPSFLTFTGYILFPFTVIAGPYFTFSRYKRFRAQTILPDTLVTSRTKLLQGVLYIALYYGGDQFISTEYLLSADYNSYNIVLKMLYMTLWSKWLITKYCAIWLMSESAAVLTGIGEGADAWSEGISNMNITKFEQSITIQDELESFNMQTHIWVKTNIYKRCKPFNSRLVSLTASLLFLYLWHGIYPGFFNLFLVEILGISSEEAVRRYFSKSLFPSALHHVLVAVQYLVKNSCVGYGLAGFALRTFSRCDEFYSSIYYCYHILLVAWIVFEITVVSNLVTRRVDRVKKAE